MLAPVWVRWLLCAAMLAVTGYHLVHGVRRWRGPCRRLPPSDLWHAAMGAGMGMMLLGVTGHDGGWWLLAFAIGAAVLAGRALDRYVVGGFAAAAHDLRRLLAGVAMCWMLAVPIAQAMPAGPDAGVVAWPDAGVVAWPDAGVVAGRVTADAGGHRHGMLGMAAGPGADPAVTMALVRGVTALLLVAVLALAARSCWVMLRGWLPDRTADAAVPPRRAVGPVPRQACRLAMHVTAAIMLAAMV